MDVDTEVLDDVRLMDCEASCGCAGVDGCHEGADQIVVGLGSKGDELSFVMVALKTVAT